MSLRGSRPCVEALGKVFAACEGCTPASSCSGAGNPRSSKCICRVQWRRQYKEFSGTPLGRAAFLGAVFFLFYTGIAFRLLNLLFLLWWIGPLIVLPLLQAASRKVRPPLPQPCCALFRYKCCCCVVYRLMPDGEQLLWSEIAYGVLQCYRRLAQALAVLVAQHPTPTWCHAVHTAESAMHVTQAA